MGKCPTCRLHVTATAPYPSASLPLLDIPHLVSLLISRPSASLLLLGIPPLVSLRLLDIQPLVSQLHPVHPYRISPALAPASLKRLLQLFAAFSSSPPEVTSRAAAFVQILSSPPSSSWPIPQPRAPAAPGTAALLPRPLHPARRKSYRRCECVERHATRCVAKLWPSRNVLCLRCDLRRHAYMTHSLTSASTATSASPSVVPPCVSFPS